MDFENKIPDGWKSLFEPIRSYMKKYNLLHPFSKMNVGAIDVSHGTFDVMISNSNAEVVKLINELKEKSSNTCMICGSSKSVGVVQDGTNAVKCYDCVLKQANEIKGNIAWYSNDESEEMFVPYLTEI